MDQRLLPSGLTTQQAALLTIIETAGRPPTMTEAARALAMSHQNVKQLAVALERKGFLEIVPDERDARSKRMETTKKHRQFWAKRNPQDHACVAQWLGELDEAETATLARLLAKARVRAQAGRGIKCPIEQHASWFTQPWFHWSGWRAASAVPRY